MTEKANVFTKHDGHESVVSVRKLRKAGEGATGRLHFVSARVRNGEKPHSVSLVFKKIKKDADFGHEEKSLSENMDDMLRVYSRLRAIGLPVLPTFRIDRERGGILMTDVTKGGKFVSLTNNTNEIMGENKFISRIDNFESLVRHVAHCAKHAAKHKISLWRDEYNIVVPVGGVGKAQLYLTDLDVTSFEPDTTVREIQEVNLEGASAFLLGIVDKYIVSERRKDYMKIILKHVGASLELDNEDLK